MKGWHCGLPSVPRTGLREENCPIRSRGGGKGRHFKEEDESMPVGSGGQLASFEGKQWAEGSGQWAVVNLGEWVSGEFLASARKQPWTVVGIRLWTDVVVRNFRRKSDAARRCRCRKERHD